MDEEAFESVADLYRDLHAHPELSLQETRTAGVVAARLRELGYEVHEGIGTTGVVGVLANGDGATVLARADMDALPVQEETGLDYASEVDGVMHACGHDVHTACLVGAAAELAASRDDWSGTVVVLFQPAEEIGKGAIGMVEDDLYGRVPRPDVVIGQHVAPLPAGVIGLRPGPAFAASDALRVTMQGRGGHGSRPETTVDTVVMAAATVLRLQGVVSREVAGTDTAVVTVGALNAGTKGNVIPDRAELLLSVRTYDAKVRARILAAIERVVQGEAAASGAPQPPVTEVLESIPPAVNDTGEALSAVRAALEQVVGAGRVVDPGSVTGSEDVGILATSAEVPLVYWLLGGADPTLFASARSVEEIAQVTAGIPSNHSPSFAPVIDPTLRVGVGALVGATRACLTSFATPAG